MAVDAGQNAVRPDRAVQLFDVRSNAFVWLRRLSSAGATRGLSGRMAVLSAYPSVAIHLDLMRCACPHLQEPALQEPAARRSASAISATPEWTARPRLTKISCSAAAACCQRACSDR